MSFRDIRSKNKFEPNQRFSLSLINLNIFKLNLIIFLIGIKDDFIIIKYK